MKIDNKIYLLLALAIGNSFAMNNPNPNQNPGGYGYNPYGYYQPYGQSPYPYGYQQPYDYPDPYGYQQPYGYPADPYGYQPQQPAAVQNFQEDPMYSGGVPAAASNPIPLVADTDDSAITAPAAAAPASMGATDVISATEQEHLDKLKLNLDNISATLPLIAASYTGTAADLATAQLHQAAVDATITTISNAPSCVKIIHWFRKANEHFAALSKPGVSRAAQQEREKLAPKLTQFKTKIEAIECKINPVDRVKNLFNKKKPQGGNNP